MNKIKRFVSLALVLCMVMAFLPVGVSAAEDASYAYNIVHVDAGRKYFTPGELKAIIDNAVVVSESEINTDNVSVGTTVKYVNVATGKESEYGIVGADEADPLKGLISNESPIGMALLGHKVGDTVEVEIPKGFLTLRIVDIHR